MSVAFKVINFKGEDTSHIEGRCEKYIENVKRLEVKYGVALPAIDVVHVGNSSMPITTIKFVNGLELLAEESTVFWLDYENQKAIEKYKRFG